MERQNVVLKVHNVSFSGHPRTRKEADTHVDNLQIVSSLQDEGMRAGLLTGAVSKNTLGYFVVLGEDMMIPEQLVNADFSIWGEYRCIASETYSSVICGMKGEKFSMFSQREDSDGFGFFVPISFMSIEIEYKGVDDWICLKRQLAVVKDRKISLISPQIWKGSLYKYHGVKENSVLVNYLEAVKAASHNFKYPHKSRPYALDTSQKGPP